MRTRGVIGKRIVAVRQQRIWDSRTATRIVAVEAIVLEDGTELTFSTTPLENDTDPAVDVLVHGPKLREAP